MTKSDVPLLEVRDVKVNYGRIEALHGVSLIVRQGELVTLLGSNGAGKTTLMRAISGLRPLAKGSVWFDGRELPTPIVERTALAAGASLAGPLIIEESGATTVIPPAWTAEVHATGNIVLRREGATEIG